MSKLKEMAKHLKLVAEQKGCNIIHCHAHEIVAAFFGYKSRASLISNKEFYFSIPENVTSLIEERIKELSDFPIIRPSSDFIEAELRSFLAAYKEVL